MQLVVEHRYFTTLESGGWSESIHNPTAGNLILITVHLRTGSVSSVSYGGVSASLVAGDDDNWPETYVYAIAEEDQPNPGLDHTISVQANTTGAVTFTKLDSIDLSLISSFSDLPSDVRGTTANTPYARLSVSLTSGHYFVLGAVTVRRGPPVETASEGILLSSGVFDSPRSYATSFSIVRNESSAMLDFVWNHDDRSGMCIVAFPLVFSTLSGKVYDKSGQPCRRALYAMSRPIDGSPPELLAHGLSDLDSGSYSLEVSPPQEVTRIVIAEDEGSPDTADPVLPDLVDRVVL